MCKARGQVVSFLSGFSSDNRVELWGCVCHMSLINLVAVIHGFSAIDSVSNLIQSGFLGRINLAIQNLLVLC